MHKRIDKIVRVGIVGPPAAQKHRVLKIANFNDIVFPFDIAHIDSKFGIQGHDIFSQHHGGSFTHLIARVMGDDHLKAFFPHLAVPGLLHIFGGFFQIKFIHRHFDMVWQTFYIRAGGHDDQIVKDVFLVSVAVKSVQKRFAHIDIGEKVRRDALAVQFAAADIRVAAWVDSATEHSGGIRQLGHLINAESLHGLDFRHIGCVDHNAIGITILKHQLAGAPFFDILDNTGFNLGCGAPVPVKAFKDKLLGGFPVLQLIRTGSVFDFLQRLVAGRRIVVFGSILNVAVPAAFGDGPFFVDNRGRRITHNAH